MLAFAFIPNKYLQQRYSTCVDYQKASYQILLKSDITDLPTLFCKPLFPFSPFYSSPVASLGIKIQKCCSLLAFTKRLCKPSLEIVSKRKQKSTIFTCFFATWLFKRKYKAKFLLTETSNKSRLSLFCRVESYICYWCRETITFKCSQVLILNWRMWFTHFAI